MNPISIVAMGVFAIGACAAACSGATDTELFGGAPGDAGASGSSGGSSNPSNPDAPPSASASGGSDLPPTKDAGCSPSNPDDCGDDQYCNVEGCAGSGGRCVKRGPETAALEPQCGCDGITYWNASVASAHGVNVAAPGACGAGKAKTCGSKGTCPSGARCNLEVPSKLQCRITAGTCWQILEPCAANAGPGTRRCVGGNGECSTYCSAIEREEPFYEAPACG